jgi:ATP-dependent RNA helicase DeaD
MTNDSFEALGLSADRLQRLVAVGYTAPTPVQQAAIPVLLEGSDAVLQAQTGTGKTAAFVLPAIERLRDTPAGIHAGLVLAPTRELAQQISVEFNRLADGTDLRAVAIFGGTGFDRQREELARAQFIVATPGRLLDFLRRREISLEHVRYFGLDEADEMLSLGFEKDVLDIARQVPARRQTFMCSATYNDTIRRISAQFLPDPVTINVSSDEIGARSVQHLYFPLAFDLKVDALRRIIRGTPIRGAIIFANTRAETFRITEALKAERFRVDVLNGDLSQAERELALSRMREDAVDFLVATDVAARGIDISGLPAVVNYDMPESADVYIHRTGRTGRAGQAGVAFSLVSPADITVFHALHKFYGLTLVEQPIPGEADVRRQLADSALLDLLERFDADRALPYGALLPLARRLLERADGPRVVAQLLAFWQQQATAKATAPEPAAEASNTPAQPPAPGPPPAAASPPVKVPVPAPAPAAPRERSQPPPAKEAPAAAPLAAAPAAPAAPARTRETPRDRRGPGRSGVHLPSGISMDDEAGVRVVSAPSVQFDGARELQVDPSGTGGGLDADRIVQWLVEQTQPGARGRFRTTGNIAKGLAVSEADVERVAGGSSQLERAQGTRPMWRLHPSIWGRVDHGNLRTSRAGGESSPAKESPPAATRPSLEEIRLNLGDQDIASPEELGRELALLSGFDEEDFQAIRIGSASSTFAVRSDYLGDIMDALRSARLKSVVLTPQRVSS